MVHWFVEGVALYTPLLVVGTLPVLRHLEIPHVVVAPPVCLWMFINIAIGSSWSLVLLIIFILIQISEECRIFSSI